LLRAEYNSRGRANPKPQKNCFALPSPFFRILNQDFVEKKFGFCSGDTTTTFPFTKLKYIIKLINK
ncbi:MAG: hypothetical protein V1851_01545, partial [Patescibacteria group bacterium]